MLFPEVGCGFTRTANPHVVSPWSSLRASGIRTDCRAAEQCHEATAIVIVAEQEGPGVHREVCGHAERHAAMKPQSWHLNLSCRRLELRVIVNKMGRRVPASGIEQGTRRRNASAA